MKNTVGYTLINGGTRYECYGLKKTLTEEPAYLRHPAVIGLLPMV